MPAIRVAILIRPDSPHIDNYLESVAMAKNVESVALTDPDGTLMERARKYAGEAAARWRGFRSEDELLRDVRPRFAVVSHPAYRSPEVIRAALESGAHVLAEKPACVRAADFAPLVRLADSKHLHLMLAVVNRATSTVAKARSVVKSGSIGRPYAAHIHLVADQTRLKSPSYQKSWFASKKESFGGFLSWLSIHYLDMLQYVAGDRITEAAAMIRNANRLPMDVEDSVAACFAMSGGLICSLHGGYYMDKSYQSGFQLWGSDGWLRFSLHGAETRGLEWCSYSGGGTVNSEPIPAEPGAYALFTQAAIDAIVSNGPPQITAAESLHLLQTVDAAYRSAAEGKAQRI